MLISRMAIFLPSRRREVGYAENSLAPEDKIRKVMKSWCIQVISNKTADIRGIQL